MTVPKLNHIETLQPPTNYSSRQILFANAVASAMDRGRLVLVEPPDPR